MAAVVFESGSGSYWVMTVPFLSLVALVEYYRIIKYSFVIVPTVEKYKNKKLIFTET